MAEWLSGRVVMQRTATPLTSVRFRSQPPNNLIMKVVIVSGGFDPIHSGHLSYINNAKKIGDYLVVALNSDEWLKNKKGKPFLPFEERKLILENLKAVDLVIDFDDDEFGSASEGIKKVQNLFPDDKIIFCNGGDRGKDNITEENIKNVDFEFGVGGDSKINSSSWILNNIKHITERVWGNYEIFYETEGVKLKKITLMPGKGMSLQNHNHRSEFWFISKGRCKLKHHKNDLNKLKTLTLNKNDMVEIAKKEWHQLYNPFKEISEIIEIQFGEATTEDDIERISFYDESKTE